MYVEGITDLMQMILVFPFSPPEAREKNLDSIKEKATNRYFPVFEKVSNGCVHKTCYNYQNFPKLRTCLQCRSVPNLWLPLLPQRKGNTAAGFLYLLACVVRAVVYLCRCIYYTSTKQYILR